MPVGTSAKGSGGWDREAIPAGGDREPARWRADRAEFLGDDGAGREYWLLGGRVYAEGHGGTFPVCPLTHWGRLRKKLRDNRGIALRRPRGRARGDAQAA
jgi:hypothetical protein